MTGLDGYEATRHLRRIPDRQLCALARGFQIFGVTDVRGILWAATPRTRTCIFGGLEVLWE